MYALVNKETNKVEWHIFSIKDQNRFQPDIYTVPLIFRNRTNAVDFKRKYIMSKVRVAYLRKKASLPYGSNECFLTRD